MDNQPGGGWGDQKIELVTSQISRGSGHWIAAAYRGIQLYGHPPPPKKVNIRSLTDEEGPKGSSEVGESGPEGEDPDEIGRDDW